MFAGICGFGRLVHVQSWITFYEAEIRLHQIWRGFPCIQHLQVFRPCPRPSPSPRLSPRPDVPSSGRAQATGFPGVRRHPWVRPTSGPPPPPLVRRPVARSSQPGAHLTRDVASSDSEDRGQHRARERTSRHVFSDLI